MSFLLTIKDLDLEFKNMPVKVVVEKSFPAIRIAGEVVGPLEVGKEAELRYWIALQLAKAGIVRFRDEISLGSLYNLYWKETIQPGNQLSRLPEKFFPMLRHYLAELKEKSAEEYEKADRLANDIVNCRLRKIVSLAATPAPTIRMLENLSEEERMIYDTLKSLIQSYRSDILKLESP